MESEPVFLFGHNNVVDGCFMAHGSVVKRLRAALSKLIYEKKHLLDLIITLESHMYVVCVRSQLSIKIKSLLRRAAMERVTYNS